MTIFICLRIQKNLIKTLAKKAGETLNITWYNWATLGKTAKLGCTTNCFY